MPLENLDGLRPVAGNWQIAGEVYFNPGKYEDAKTSKGKGILVNIPTDKNKDNILTTWEHGDIELELDFMMAKGSNAGVYLQGRYEIQLFDSWGVKNPKASDCGGIYERWDESRPEGQKGYEGHPPRINVSKAPGLWQHYRIIFQAPRFDNSGKKTANARFVKVMHNGVVIHENVELSGPTRSAAFNDEKAQGPLMIQGDHGKVAVRNIRYKKFDKAPVALQNVQYAYYEGKFETLPDLSKLKPVQSGPLESITWEAGKAPNDFAFRFTGNLQVKEAGEYRFELVATGASRLLVGNQVVIDHDGFHDRTEVADGKISLPQGSHPVTVLYSKSTSWFRPALGLYVEGPGIYRHPLHDPESLPEPEVVGDIVVNARHEPVVLRSFVEHHGKKKTQCALVGEPAGLNYVVDLEQGNILQLWKGDFTDATEMWHERGEAQLAQPLGSIIYFPDQPTFAILNSNNARWPDSNTVAADFQFKAYELNKAGRPVFRYTMQGTSIADMLEPENNNHILTRELTVQNENNTKNLYCRVAEGKTITQLPDGSYGVDDMQFYVQLKETNGIKPVIREVNNRKELLLPLPDSNKQVKVKYAIIW